MTRSLVDAAARASLLGVGGSALLTAEQFEARVRLAVLNRAVELDRERARMWAIEIANAVGQLFRK